MLVFINFLTFCFILFQNSYKRLFYSNIFEIVLIFNQIWPKWLGWLALWINWINKGIFLKYFTEYFVLAAFKLFIDRMFLRNWWLVHCHVQIVSTVYIHFRSIYLYFISKILLNDPKVKIFIVFSTVQHFKNTNSTKRSQLMIYFL